jgi:hypothetical protein
MNFTILIQLMPLLAFTYFVVLPVSLSSIAEMIVVKCLRRLRNGNRDSPLTNIICGRFMERRQGGVCNENKRN